MSAKGAGATFYIDVNSDDTYTEIGCIREMTPPGITRAVVTEPPCLASTGASAQDTDDAQYTEMTLIVDMARNGTEDASLLAAIIADTTIQVCIKYPEATPVYDYFDAKLTGYQPQSVQRNQTIRCQISLIQTTAFTTNTTAPTTS